MSDDKTPLETGIQDLCSSERLSVIRILIIGFTAANYLYNGIMRPLFTQKIDFEAYYNAALAFRYRLPLYQFMVDFFEAGPYHYQGPLPYVYPPFMAILLSPLAYLSFHTAAIMWLILNQALFFAGTALLLRSIAPTSPRPQVLITAIAFMNFTPLFLDILLGQSNIILFFLMVTGLYMFRTGRPVYAGMAIGLACSIKIIPFLLLVYALWKGQWRVFVSGILTIVLTFAYSLLFFDIGLFSWYFKFMMNQTLFDAFPDNHSLTGFFARFLTRSVWIKGIFDAPDIARLCVVLSSALIVGMFLFVTRRKIKPSDPEFVRGYGLAVISMLLLSKMTSTPYLVMLLLPIGVAIKGIWIQDISRGWLLLLAAAYGTLAVWYPLPAGKFLEMKNYSLLLSGLPAGLFSVQFLALLVFWCFFAFGWRGNEKISLDSMDGIPLTNLPRR